MKSFPALIVIGVAFVISVACAECPDYGLQTLPPSGKKGLPTDMKIVFIEKCAGKSLVKNALEKGELKLRPEKGASVVLVLNPDFGSSVTSAETWFFATPKGGLAKNTKYFLEWPGIPAKARKAFDPAGYSITTGAEPAKFILWKGEHQPTLINMGRTAGKKPEGTADYYTFAVKGAMGPDALEDPYYAITVLPPDVKQQFTIFAIPESAGSLRLGEWPCGGNFKFKPNVTYTIYVQPKNWAYETGLPTKQVVLTVAPK